MKNSKEDAGKQHEKGTSNKQSSAKGSDNNSEKESVGSKKLKGHQGKESSKK